MKSLKRMLYELTMDKEFVALKFLIDRPEANRTAKRVFKHPITNE